MMMRLNLIQAFARFGAKPLHRLTSQSAIATDGAVVLNCTQPYFVHPQKGVLRYEDRLSRNSANAPEAARLGEHLALARDGAVPVRLVVQAVAEARGKITKHFHVRPDLIGKVTLFDGDHFIVDFTRPEAPRMTGKSRNG